MSKMRKNTKQAYNLQLTVRFSTPNIHQFFTCLIKNTAFLKDFVTTLSEITSPIISEQQKKITFETAFTLGQPMGYQSAYNNKWCQKKQWKLVERLAVLSHYAENMPVKHPLFIITFLLLQCILGTALPILAVSSVSGYWLTQAKAYSQLICSELLSGSVSDQGLLFGIAAGIFTLQLVIAIGLLFSHKQKHVRRVLYTFLFWQPLSTFLIYLQSQTFIIMEPTSQSTSIKYLLCFLCVINLTLIVLANLVFKFVFYTYNPTAQNTICRRFSILEITISVLMKIFAVYVPLAIQEYNKAQNIRNVFQITVVFFYLLVLLLKLKIEVKLCIFRSKETEKIYQKFLMFESAIIVVSFLCLFEIDGLIQQNFHFLLITLWIFGFMTLQNTKNNIEFLCQVMQEEDKFDQNMAQNYLIILNDVFAHLATTSSAALLNNLYSKHLKECNNQSCYCRGLNQNHLDQKKELNSHLVVDSMNRILQKFSSSWNILLLVSYMKLKVHQKYADTLWKIKEIQQKIANYPFYCKVSTNKYQLALESYFEEQNFHLNIAKVEKCIESEIYLNYLADNFSKLVKIKLNFWSFFSKGNVEYRAFEQNIDSQLQMVRIFDQMHKSIFDNFGNSHALLSMIIAYEKFIVLKDSLSKPVMQKINILAIQGKRIFRRKQNTDRVFVNKWLFSQNSCTIQIDMTPTALGQIETASKNVENIFGYSPAGIQGHNINKIMPTAMKQQHNNILKRWSRNCYWENFGKLKTIFAVTRNNVSFSCSIYLKLIQKAESIHIMGTIFKENDKDYMIISDEGIVIGAGQNFLSILGPNIIGLSFSSICQESSKVNIWLKEDEQTKQRSKFYSICQNCMGAGEQQHQKISSIVTEQEIAEKLDSKEHLKQNSFQQSAFNLIEFRVRAYKIGKKQFAVLKYQSIIESLGSKNESQEDRESRYPADDKSSMENQKEEEVGFVVGNSSVGSTASSVKRGFVSNLFMFQSAFLGRETFKDRRIYKVAFILGFMLVIALGACSAKLFVNDKGSYELQQLYIADGSCSDNLQLSFYFFNRGLTLSNDITKYKSALKQSQQKAQQIKQQLKSDVQNYREQLSYLSGLVRNQIYKINTKLTSLSNQPLYQYQTHIVEWVTRRGQRSQLSINKFLNNYIYFSEAIYRVIDRVLATPLQNITQPFLEELQLQIRMYNEQMQPNFNTLVRINQQYLQLYISLIQNTTRIINTVSYTKISLMISIVVFVLSFLYKYFEFRSQQDEGIISQYQSISLNFTSNLCSFYRKMNQIFERSRNAKNIEINMNSSTARRHRGKNNIDRTMKQFQKCFEAADIDYAKSMQQIGHNKKQKMVIHGRPTDFSLIFYIVVLAAVVALNASMFRLESNILLTAQNMMHDMNYIIDSENDLIEMYYKFKSQNSLHGNETKYNREAVLGLLKRVNTSSSVFSTMVVESFGLFQLYDSRYHISMTKLVTKNICEINKGLVSEKIYKQCQQNKQSRLLRAGIINAMTYFFRSLQSALHQYMSLTEQQANDPEFLRSMSTLRMVDKNSYLMFKMYQAIQGLMAESVSVAIVEQSQLYFVQGSLEFAILGGIVVYLVYFYFQETARSTERVGKILLLPVKLLKHNSKMMKKFQVIIDYLNIK